MKYRIAVVGCGAITALTHIPTILRSNLFDLRVLVDPVTENAEFLCLKYALSNVNITADYKDLSDVDAAVVAVPPHLHASICCALLQKGIHVYCEKPMANSPAEAEEMIRVARSNDLALSIGAHKYFYENTQLLKNILHDGDLLGSLQSVSLTYGIESNWNAANPKRFNPDYVPGGVVFESGIHWLYRLQYWFGQCSDINYQDDRIGGVEANAIIDYFISYRESPVPVRLRFSSDIAMKNSLIITGEKGILEMNDNETMGVDFYPEKSSSEKWYIKLKDNEIEHDNYYDFQLAHFARSFESTADKYLLAELSLKTACFINYCYENRENIKQPWVFTAT